MPNFIDFTTFFINIAKVSFIYYIIDARGYNTNKICKTTREFFSDLEILSYDLCKMALVDGYTKRYSISYISASLLISAFEILLD